MNEEEWQQTASAFGSIAAEQRAARRARREETRDFLNALSAILDRLDRDPPPSAA